jgi:DNA repair protein RecO (recombination protein O)
MRGGRASQKRAGGALEPFHTVRISFVDSGGEIASLREAEIVTPRIALSQSLEALTSAGTLLRWVRHLTPPRTPELSTYAIVEESMDRFNQGIDPAHVLVNAGMRVLRTMGYGLELRQCIACGKERLKCKAAHFDAKRGGILCHACGVGPVFSGALLDEADALAQTLAVQPGEHSASILTLLEHALSVHTEMK